MRVVAIDPQYVSALNNKGLALYNLGNYSEAILYYDKALVIQSNYTYALDNKGAALNNLGNFTGAILYYNKALAIDPKNTFALTNKDAILHMLGNNSTYSTYQNSTYGIKVQYPSDWSVQKSNTTGTLIKIAAFVSPTGPDSNPDATVALYIDRLHNSTTTINNYAHFDAFTYYENRPSYFHAFKLLELSTNSSKLAGKPAYTIIGTYQNPPFGLQQLMETGIIIGDKAYSVQYIADAHRYYDYLPIVQKMIDSMQITSQGNGPYGMTMGPNETMSITSGNISATLTAPPGSKVNNFTIVPEGIVPEGNTSYAYPPPTITYSLEPGNNPDCSNCYFQTFIIHDGPYVYKGYSYSGDSEAHREYLNLCATRTIYEKAASANFQHPVKDCVSLPPSYEPSYKWGYWYGFNSHKCTVTDSKGSVCDTTSNALSLICANYGNITSSTGCKNGYLDGAAGWLHCRVFPKDCHKSPQVI